MKIFLFIGIVFLAAACVDPLVIKNTSGASSLTVDGMISDQPGPYTIKITRTLAIDDQLDKLPVVSGAIVTIRDDHGESETLKEINPGIYETAVLRGVVGNTYTLSIVTPDDGSYTSSAETMLPVGDFTDLHYEFNAPENPGLPIELDTKNGFTIIAGAALDPQNQKLVRFRWTGTFEIVTYPQLRKKLVYNRAGVASLVADPVACSGAIVQGQSVVQKGACTCCTCWVNQFNQTPLFSDPQFVNHDTISNFKVDFISANRRYLYDKYYLSVEMLSTSATVLDFWKRIAAQQQQGSDLFQTAAGPTGGNLTPVTPGATPVIGVFSAAAIKTRTITVTREDVPYFIPDIDSTLESCLTLYKNSTTVKPLFW